MRTLDDCSRPLIVFSDCYPDIYGAQRSLLSLYTQWHRQRRYRLHFTYTVAGELSEAIAVLGIPTTRLPVGPLLGSFNKRLLNLGLWEYAPLAGELVAHARIIRRLLIKQGAALFHCNNDRAGLMSFLGARWARCPMMTHIRRDRSFGRLDRIIHAGTTEIIWVSRRVRDEFARNNNIKTPKGRVIYNGRNLPDSDGPRTDDEVRSEFNLPRGALLALVLAGFDVRKDHETLIRAARIACHEEPRLYILLAGMDFTPDQSRRRRIEALVHEGGLSQRVLFLGHRRDVGRLLRGVDVLVNPAKEEALGGALIEAIGYGVPCVATDTGGTAEIVPPGRCGFLVPRQDHVALAKRLVELLRDETTRNVFSKNARAHFAENFTMERCAEKTGAFFDQVIAARRQGHRRRER